MQNNNEPQDVNNTGIVEQLILGASAVATTMVTTLYDLYKSRYKDNSKTQDITDDMLNGWTARKPRHNK